jgi:transposase
LSRAAARSFYAEKYGRPSLTPGIYFRALLIGYFEGIGAERGITWRLADSLALRRFVRIALLEPQVEEGSLLALLELAKEDFRSSSARSNNTTLLEVMRGKSLEQLKANAKDANAAGPF